MNNYVQPISYSYRQDASVPSVPDDKPLFVFDGVCVLCSSGAGWLMRHDKQRLFRFTSAQSPLGQALYRHYGVALDETYLLLDKGQLFDKSAGYLRMIEILGGWWLFWKIFRLIPRRIRDYFYDVIARNRYKWFGKTEYCKLIPEDLARTLL
jgi:predicted DCC family thiol-disulfide oxidoreductase YuxK